MDCKHIQESIITDYIDGRASAALQMQVQDHLAQCAACRAFEQAVRSQAVQPFQTAGKQEPPHQLWQDIKVAIQQAPAQHKPALLERLYGVIRESVAAHRPAYALVPVMTLILMVTLYFQSPMYKQMLVKDYLGSQVSFMTAMAGSANGDLDDVAGFNSAIEEALF